MSDTIEQKIDQLLHDAEHAEAGAEFADMLLISDPMNEDHAKHRDEYRAKAKRLRAEAKKLQESA